MTAGLIILGLLAVDIALAMLLGRVIGAMNPLGEPRQQRGDHVAEQQQ